MSQLKVFVISISASITIHFSNIANEISEQWIKLEYCSWIEYKYLKIDSPNVLVYNVTLFFHRFLIRQLPARIPIQKTNISIWPEFQWKSYWWSCVHQRSWTSSYFVFVLNLYIHSHILCWRSLRSQTRSVTWTTCRINQFKHIRPSQYFFDPFT